MSSPSIRIKPPVNVTVKGVAQPLPSNAEIIKDGTYDPYCTILELIAAQLHAAIGGTTASTTTIGLISDIATLFVTNQGNNAFKEVDSKKVHGMLEFLRTCEYSEFLESMKLGYVYKLKEKDVIAIREKTAPKNKSVLPFQKREAKDKITDLNFVYYILYPSFARVIRIRETTPDAFKILTAWINDVQAITTDQMFASTAETTGLHGEGRFVRFCYIRYVQGLRLQEIHFGDGIQFITPSTTKVFQSILQDAADFSGRALADKVQQMRILVSSSQGTCQDCQKMLKGLRISHNTQRYSHEAASPYWVNPFTMARLDALFAPSKYLLAENVAKELAIRYFEDKKDEGTWKTGTKESKGSGSDSDMH